MQSTWKHQHAVSHEAAHGFSLAELAVAMGIIGIVTAISIPTVRSSINAYTLNSAVTSITGSIQSTRYRAVEAGYPFAIVVNRASSNYQLQNDPADSGSFANVGNPIPFSSAVNILGSNTTLVFRPGGAVQCPQCAGAQIDASGNWVLTVSCGNNPTETITVSPYGRINVTP